MKKLLLILTVASLSFANAHAQIGWTLDQCRKHWGRESIATYHLESLNDTTYSFGSKDFGIHKDVTLDSQGKVNNVCYSSNGGDSQGARSGLLKIPRLLAREEGIIWERDPDESYTSRHEYFIGKKDGVAVFHARYFSGKTGESLHVLPIESPL
jgi:hypothetical protein